MIRDDLKCPHCGRELYRYQPVIPIVGQCKRCEKPLRLVGDQFITWPAWLQIKARLVLIEGGV